MTAGGQRIETITAGLPINEAKAAMIMVHGRGATAAGLLELVDELGVEGFAYLAPQAPGNTWYPLPFNMPRTSNEPGLSQALAAVEALIGTVEAAGIEGRRIALLGFSQGACVALDVAARTARTIGLVVGLSGGLIGSDEELRGYRTEMKGVHAFLGCSDRDSFIPAARVERSAELLESLGASVALRIYPGMGHVVNLQEIGEVRTLMQALIAP